MISTDLARRLCDAGVVWHPVKGDRFVVPDHDLDDTVFVVSDMVVEVREVADGGRVLAFNGTTEWALDSLEAEEALWLPREDQLRDLLGAAFETLESLPGPQAGFAVTAAGRRCVDVTVEDAYARAVLGLTAGS